MFPKVINNINNIIIQNPQKVELNTFVSHTDISNKKSKPKKVIHLMIYSKSNKDRQVIM